MKSTTIPMTCGLALATMSIAVLSHWWSVRLFVNAPLLASVQSRTIPSVTRPLLIPEAKHLAKQEVASTSAVPSTAQKEFYESMLDEMKQIKKSNVALRDQMAETNRDLMKLEFRVDTHSESFRPLPVTEDVSKLSEPTPDDGPGVLPARPTLVGMPELE